ncbi:hypothetical protein RB195_017270 [Necator americanus]|uniref:Uncharacterized protein n=1 Tax=Necator americanus TaxID=51031 RepID=A0ABR1C4H2_NECAM
MPSRCDYVQLRAHRELKLWIISSQQAVVVGIDAIAKMGPEHQPIRLKMVLSSGADIAHRKTPDSTFASRRISPLHPRLRGIIGLMWQGTTRINARRAAKTSTSCLAF